MPFAHHNNQCKVCHTKQLRIEFIIASENHRHKGSVWWKINVHTAEPNTAREMNRTRVIEFESGSRKKPPSTNAINFYWMLCATKHFTLFSVRANTCPHSSHLYKYTFRIDELLLAVLFNFYIFCVRAVRSHSFGADEFFLTMLRKFTN